MSSGTIVAIVVPISVAVVIFIVGICCLCKRIRNKYDSESAIGISNVVSLQYDFSTIKAATNNFSTKIGTGSFGDVFKGTLLNGQEIAVKRLSTKSGQDSKSPKKLDWAKRYKIVKEIAQGIQYLHSDSRISVWHYFFRLIKLQEIPTTLSEHWVIWLPNIFLVEIFL